MQKQTNKVLNFRINDQIRSPEVRVFDQNGTDIGIVSIQNALAMAANAELDLVEVAPNGQPPVCKILDYGKEQYEAQKKQKRAKKNTKAVSLKEIRLTARIDDHDYNVKIKHAIRFLTEDNDKVNVCIIFRGRELDYKEIAYRIVERVKKDLLEVAKIESEPKLDRRRMNMTFAPLGKSKVIKNKVDKVIADDTDE